MRSDAWGWAARIGILVIHDDPVAESELWATAPPGVSLHTARFERPGQCGREYGPDAARVLAESPDVARGLEFFGQLEVDVACLCFASASLLAGPGFDAAFAACASPVAGGIPVTTAADALVDALRATEVSRPVLVVPPWSAESGEDVERFFAGAGVEMADTVPFDLGPGWRGMKPDEVCENRGYRHVRPEDVYRQVRRAFPATADGVLVPGSGFRSLEAVELLERDLGVPVITANLASLWHCLQLVGIQSAVTGRGRLFDRRLPGLCRRAGRREHHGNPRDDHRDGQRNGAREGKRDSQRPGHRVLSVAGR